jgi:hypothetical protein
MIRTPFKIAPIVRAQPPCCQSSDAREIITGRSALRPYRTTISGYPPLVPQARLGYTYIEHFSNSGALNVRR